MRAAAEMLFDLKNTGTQKDWLDRMQTRKELYDLLDYDPAADTEKKPLARHFQPSTLNDEAVD